MILSIKISKFIDITFDLENQIFIAIVTSVKIIFNFDIKQIILKMINFMIIFILILFSNFLILNIFHIKFKPIDHFVCLFIEYLLRIN